MKWVAVWGLRLMSSFGASHDDHSEAVHSNTTQMKSRQYFDRRLTTSATDFHRRQCGHRTLKNIRDFTGKCRNGVRIAVVRIAVLEDQPNVPGELVCARIRRTWLDALLAQSAFDRAKIHRFLDNVEIVGDIVGYGIDWVAKWFCFACFKQARKDVFDILLLMFGNAGWWARSVLRGLSHSSNSSWHI